MAFDSKPGEGRLGVYGNGKLGPLNWPCPTTSEGWNSSLAFLECPCVRLLLSL